MLELFDYVNLLGISLEIIGFFLLLPRMARWIKQRIESDYINQPTKNIEEIHKFYQDLYIKLNQTIKFTDDDDAEVLDEKLEKELKELEDPKTAQEIMYFMFLIGNYRHRIDSLKRENDLDSEEINRTQRHIDRCQNRIDEAIKEKIGGKQLGKVEVFGIILVIIGLSGQGISVLIEKIFMS